MADIFLGKYKSEAWVAGSKLDLKHYYGGGGGGGLYYHWGNDWSDYRYMVSLLPFQIRYLCQPFQANNNVEIGELGVASLG